MPWPCYSRLHPKERSLKGVERSAQISGAETLDGMSIFSFEEIYVCHKKELEEGDEAATKIEVDGSFRWAATDTATYSIWADATRYQKLGDINKDSIIVAIGAKSHSVNVTVVGWLRL